MENQSAAPAVSPESTPVPTHKTITVTAPAISENLPYITVLPPAQPNQKQGVPAVPAADPSKPAPSAEQLPLFVVPEGQSPKRKPYQRKPVVPIPGQKDQTNGVPGPTGTDPASPGNRIEAAMAAVDALEARTIATFQGKVKPETLERMKNEDRIDGYRDILRRFRPEDLGEKSILRGIAFEKQELEKKVPRKGFRFQEFLENITAPFRKQEKVKDPVPAPVTAQKATNHSSAMRKQRPGAFISLLLKIDRKINRGSYKGRINESTDLGDGQRLNYSTAYSLGKDGKGKIDRIEVSMVHASDPSLARIKVFDWSKGEGFTKEQIRVLMTGGEVYQTVKNQFGMTFHHWKSIDFNDRDANGQYRFKENPAPDPAQMRKAIENVPGIRGQQSPQQIDRLVAQVLDGHRVPLSLKFGSKQTDIFLTACAASDISVTGRDRKPVRLDAIKGVVKAPKDITAAAVHENKISRKKSTGMKVA